MCNWRATSRRSASNKWRPSRKRLSPYPNSRCSSASTNARSGSELPHAWIGEWPAFARPVDAQHSEFARGLWGKYDTNVGKRGVKLTRAAATNLCRPRGLRRAPHPDVRILGSASMDRANPNSSAIRTENVCRHYPMGESLVRAVDGISIDIPAGEFVALLGASGSGKSSLLNLVAGLDRPTAGAVIVQGKNLAALSRDDLAKYRLHTVGMVFQSFNLISSMTLLENVELPLRFAEVDRRERGALARQSLERVGLGGRLAHRPMELSGGEQQRASLARALINRPQLLLADEPTGNLDSRTGTEIMELIRDFNQSLGMTVLMVTHEEVLAEKYAGRMVHLADGRLVDDLPKVTAPTGVRNGVEP